MELNSRYLNNFGSVRETRNGYQVKDNRGNTILKMQDDYIRNGDLVALLRVNGTEQIMKLESDFRIDNVVRAKFISELNSVLTDMTVVSIGYYYRDSSGKMSVSGTVIH